MKKFLTSSLTLLFSLTAIAANNCCAGHGDVASCDDATGQLMCMDGTDSETCECPTKDSTKSYDDKLCTPSYVSLALSQEVTNAKFPMDPSEYTASVNPLLMCGDDQTDIMNPYGKIKYLDVAYVLLATLSYNKFSAGTVLYKQPASENDLISAISWYKLCADDGITDCQQALANIYLLGSSSSHTDFKHMEGYAASLNGFLPNLEQAQKYQVLASKNQKSEHSIYQYIIKTNNANVSNYLAKQNKQTPIVDYQHMT